MSARSAPTRASRAAWPTTTTATAPAVAPAAHAVAGAVVINVGPATAATPGAGATTTASAKAKAKSKSKAKAKAIFQCQELGITDEQILNIFISANYQLSDFKSVFGDTYLLIQGKRYGKAILNIASSKWMQQTPIRAGDMISAITKLV